MHYWGVALNTAGEYSNANEKFDAAVEMYRRLGAGQRWIDRAEAAKHSSVPAPKAHKPAATSPDPAIFRKEGEFWTLAYQGATVRLRDIKGLAYIAVLLAHPGERFHAKELVTIVGGASIGKSANGSLAGGDLSVTNDLSGSDPSLDPRARTDYRSRLKELQVELDEADRFHDIGRAARAREELDFLNAELAAGLGIGGHARSSSAHAERARLMVTKSIRTALDKIRQGSPALGRYFATSISTGYFCSYQPQPEDDVSWQLHAD
jgi:non-specific serine/threonine protein kinase